MYNKKNIINDYNNWAKNYDLIVNPTRDLDQKILKTIIQDVNNKEIIEAGCGREKYCLFITICKKYHCF